MNSDKRNIMELFEDSEKGDSSKSGSAPCYLCDYCKDRGRYSAQGETLKCPYCDGKDRTLFACECGEDSFTYVDGILRCHGCRNEFKIPNAQNGDCESWMRRFNLETKEYNQNWEHCPSHGFGR